MYIAIKASDWNRLTLLLKAIESTSSPLGWGNHQNEFRQGCRAALISIAPASMDEIKAKPKPPKQPKP